MTSLYVIGPNEGPFKIGYAKDARKRANGFQTGSHADLIVHFSRELSLAVCRRAERQAHLILWSNRVRGEWFDVTLERAIEVVSSVDGMEPEKLVRPDRKPRDLGTSRQREHDKRRIEDGWKRLPLWLKPENLAAMKKLRLASGESDQEIIRQAIQRWGDEIST